MVTTSLLSNTILAILLLTTPVQEKHLPFVSSAIYDLVSNRSVIQVEKSELHVCSPLGVVEQAKLRLILALRVLN